MTPPRHSLPLTNLSMLRFSNLLSFVLVLLVSFAFAVPNVHAEGFWGDLGTGVQGSSNTGTTNVSGGFLENPLSVDTLPELLGAILDGIINIGVVVITIMLVYCGFLFVVAQGNEEKIRDARSALLWTIIGALILLGAKSIQLVISATVDTLK